MKPNKDVVTLSGSINGVILMSQYMIGNIGMKFIFLFGIANIIYVKLVYWFLFQYN